MLEIDDRDEKNIVIAGLCHDLGHGPFSHCFDNLFIRKILPGTDWTHEWASTMLLEHIVDTNHIDLDRDDIRMVSDLIMGESDAAKYQDKIWMFDIVNNKRNSMDVDKFDYIRRDSFNLKINSGAYDAGILIKTARVIDDQLCYPDKFAFEVIKLF